MATVDDDREHSTSGTYREAETLLTTAEMLNKDCEENERAISSGKTAAVILWVLSLMMVIAGVLLIWLAQGVWGIFVIFLSVWCAGYGTWDWIQTKGPDKLLQRDRRILFEIVNMLREVENAIAERNHVSALERAEFRIRLSRFDIGAEPDRKTVSAPTPAANQYTR